MSVCSRIDTIGTGDYPDSHTFPFFFNQVGELLHDRILSRSDTSQRIFKLFGSYKALIFNHSFIMPFKFRFTILYLFVYRDIRFAGS